MCSIAQVHGMKISHLGSIPIAGTVYWRMPTRLGSYQVHGYVVNMTICREVSRGTDWYNTGASATL